MVLGNIFFDSKVYFFSKVIAKVIIGRLSLRLQSYKDMVGVGLVVAKYPRFYPVCVSDSFILSA